MLTSKRAASNVLPAPGADARVVERFSFLRYNEKTKS